MMLQCKWKFLGGNRLWVINWEHGNHRNQKWLSEVHWLRTRFPRGNSVFWWRDESGTLIKMVREVLGAAVRATTSTKGASLWGGRQASPSEKSHIFSSKIPFLAFFRSWLIENGQRSQKFDFKRGFLFLCTAITFSFSAGWHGIISKAISRLNSWKLKVRACVNLH